ncbi:hypothetical protein PIB30_068099, partial [Stylosanthes scabra]|nr:hypothetical protein [Stylosanthes scabra]
MSIGHGYPITSPNLIRIDYIGSIIDGDIIGFNPIRSNLVLVRILNLGERNPIRSDYTSQFGRSSGSRCTLEQSCLRRITIPFSAPSHARSRSASPMSFPSLVVASTSSITVTLSSLSLSSIVTALLALVSSTFDAARV